MFSESWSFSLFVIFYKGNMSTSVTLISEHMFCLPAGWSTLGGISVCFWIRRSLWVWTTDWRCWNNTGYFVFIVSKVPPHTFLLTQCQMGHIWTHNSDFLHCRLFTLQDSFIWNYPGEPLCLKHKMIWKVKNFFFFSKPKSWRQMLETEKPFLELPRSWSKRQP